jgi:hypothetical protein
MLAQQREAGAASELSTFRSEAGVISSRTAIVVAGYDPGYLRILEHQVLTEVEQGRRPVVIDLTAAAAAPIDSYDRAALRWGRLKFPGHDIQLRLDAAGAEYRTVSDLHSGGDDAPLDAELEKLLAIAVQSALISYFRTDRPNREKRLVGRIARSLEREGRVVFRAVTAVLRDLQGVDRLLVPNGRYPSQKMAALAADRLEIATSHFEKGETPNGTYLQDYAPQDRLKSQASVDTVLARVSDAEIDEIAETWLKRRAPSTDSSNEFSALWKQGLPPEVSSRLQSGKRVVGFFTSSQDEFQFLGPEWQLHDWDDQFEAFEAMLEEVESAGLVAYLRVHPNLATKAQDCFLRERAGISRLATRHPDLIVIWHDDPVSSYALLDLTDAVVVWDSTVGLEASARGLPVWTMATTRYGLVADVRERLSEEPVHREGVESWTVNPRAANRFIAYLVLRDQQMAETYESWIPWDTDHPPFITKVAAALVSGGTPYRREAIKSVVDVYRHRRLKSNLAHVRGR